MVHVACCQKEASAPPGTLYISNPEYFSVRNLYEKVDKQKYRYRYNLENKMWYMYLKNHIGIIQSNSRVYNVHFFCKGTMHILSSSTAQSKGELVRTLNCFFFQLVKTTIFTIMPHTCSSLETRPTQNYIHVLLVYRNYALFDCKTN